MKRSMQPTASEDSMPTLIVIDGNEDPKKENASVKSIKEILPGSKLQRGRLVDSSIIEVTVPEPSIQKNQYEPEINVKMQPQEVNREQPNNYLTEEFNSEQTNNYSTEDFYLKINIDYFDVTYKLCDDFGAVFKPYILLLMPGNEAVKIPIYNIDEEKLNISDIGGNGDSANTTLNMSTYVNNQNTQISTIQCNSSSEKKYFYKTVII